MMARMRVLSCRDADVGDRITIDQKEVGQIAFAHQTQLVRHAHDLAAIFGCGLQRFHRREAEHVNECLDVLCVGALRRPGKAVVAANADAYSAAVHFLHGLDAHFELAFVKHRDLRSAA